MNINQIDQIMEESEKSSKTSKMDLKSSLVTDESCSLSSITEEKYKVSKMNEIPKSIPLPKIESFPATLATTGPTDHSKHTEVELERSNSLK